MVNESAWPEREKERARELERKGEGEGETCNEVIPFPISFFPRQTCLQHTRTQAAHSKQETSYKRTIEKSIFSSYSSFGRVRDAK